MVLVTSVGMIGLKQKKGDLATGNAVSAQCAVQFGTVLAFPLTKYRSLGLTDFGRTWFKGCETCVSPGMNAGGWNAEAGGDLWFPSLEQTFSIAFDRAGKHRPYLLKGISF